MSNNNNDLAEKQREINAKLRSTFVALPEKTNQQWWDHIRNKISTKPPKETETDRFSGNDLLFSTYSENRLPGVSWQAVKALTPDITLTADDPVIANKMGKLSVLATDLHDNIFPCYVRAGVVTLYDLDRYEELNNTNLVLCDNTAMSFSPDPAGIYAPGTKPFDFRQFRADMKYLGRDVDLSLLPPCPIQNPNAYHTWMSIRKLSRSADILYTETDEKTDINDYYAAWSLYKSFKFHGGTEENPHTDIAFAGCMWTLTRPTRTEPALIFKVCRFDPIAFFFEDRAAIIEKYLDIRKKRDEGKDPVPPLTGPETAFAYSADDLGEVQDPEGFTDEELAAAHERVKDSIQPSLAVGMDFSTSQEEVARKAQRDAMKVTVNAAMTKLFTDDE